MNAKTRNVARFALNHESLGQRTKKVVRHQKIVESRAKRGTSIAQIGPPATSGGDFLPEVGLPETGVKVYFRSKTWRFLDQHEIDSPKRSGGDLFALIPRQCVKTWMEARAVCYMVGGRNISGFIVYTLQESRPCGFPVRRWTLYP